MPGLPFVALGLFLVLVGNQSGKSRPMRFIGIRTPWTRADPDTWTATHRLGGRLMVAAGLLCWAFAAAGAPPTLAPGRGDRRQRHRPGRVLLSRLVAPPMMAVLRGLTMVAAGLAMVATGPAAAAATATAREVTIAGGAVTLHGTLLLPDGTAKVPGVVIIAGSGPTDRDGNSRVGLTVLRNDSLRLLAEGLAARGIASLRVDKREIGVSQVPGLDETTLRFGTYVADAKAWTTLLAAELRIARVVLLGHSEGALVATLAAQGSTVDGVVTLAGAGEPAAAVLRRQFRSALPPALVGPAEATLDSLVAGQPVAAPPPELLAVFRPSVQPYLMSWLPLDPARELAKLTVPVLIVQGTTDLQVGEGDAKLLAAARPDARLAIIPGMNHVLKVAPADRAANLATYNDPALPLAPGLIEAIAGFVVAVAK